MVKEHIDGMYHMILKILSNEKHVLLQIELYQKINMNGFRLMDVWCADERIYN